jgi:hypothetical protein
MQSDFYTNHADEVIRALEDFARSEEFFSLRFRVARKDAFEYVILYLNDNSPFSIFSRDYTIDIRLADSTFILHYLAFDEAYTAHKMEFTFDTIGDIAAHIAFLKPMIVRVFERIRLDWQMALDELDAE